MRGAVAAGTAPAAEAGATTLAQGGNAVDAAVPAALTMAVADPANASLAGRCHVLIAFPDGGAVALDGRSALPRAFATDSTPPVPSGPRVVSVPGIPRTLERAVAHFGRLPWPEVCRPAAQLARTGFAVPRCLGAAW